MNRGLVRRMTFGIRERDRRTNYQRGADFERKVRDHLVHDLGARLVVRSAGSHGAADLVALFPSEDIVYDDAVEFECPTVWLVQAKRDGVISTDDRETLATIAAETGTHAFLAWHEPGHGVRLKEIK